LSLAFSRSLRALGNEPRGLQTVCSGLAVLFGAAWLVWFFYGRVCVVATVEDARIEVALVGHRLQVPVSGNVVTAPLRMGSRVQPGDLLLELDAAKPRADRDRNAAERAGAEGELQALAREIKAVAALMQDLREAQLSHAEEADARRELATNWADFGEEEGRRRIALGVEGLLSSAEVSRGLAEAKHLRNEAVVASLAALRTRADQRVSVAERVEHLAQLQRDEASLQSKISTLDAEAREAERAVELRRVRAPVAGLLGDVVPLTPGSFVQAGDVIATLIPDGELRVVAQFPPDQALGRLRAGQLGRMRLYGFPWTQYGSIPVRVAHVAEEAQQGQVRVELSIPNGSARNVPLQHGLPGSVEVEIERASPAELVWRAAGKKLASERSAP
jgi:multidrug resistance efflux pump